MFHLSVCFVCLFVSPCGCQTLNLIEGGLKWKGFRKRSLIQIRVFFKKSRYSKSQIWHPKHPKSQNSINLKPHRRRHRIKKVQKTSYNQNFKILRMTFLKISKTKKWPTKHPKFKYLKKSKSNIRKPQIKNLENMLHAELKTLIMTYLKISKIQKITPKAPKLQIFPNFKSRVRRHPIKKV